MGSAYSVAAIWIDLGADLDTPGIAVSLVEILVGVLAGNAFHARTTAWIESHAGTNVVRIAQDRREEPRPGATRHSDCGEGRCRVALL